MKINLIFLFFILFSSSLFASEISRDFTHKNLHYTLETLAEDYYSLEYSNEETDALYNYALEDYKELNPALRNLNSVVLKEFKTKICSLDSALKKYKVKGLTLYRGSRHIQPGGDVVGFTFHQNAFTSTSIDRGVAINFATSKTPHIIDVIEVKSFPIEGAWLNQLSDFNEEEILLPRGLTFRVEKVEQQKLLDKSVTVRTLSIIEHKVSSEVQKLVNCL